MGDRGQCSRLRNSTQQKWRPGNSLAVQWLRLRTSTVGGTGLIPGLGTKIPHAAGSKKKKKKKKKEKWRPERAWLAAETGAMGLELPGENYGV